MDKNQTNIAYQFSLLNAMVISILVHQTFIVMKFDEEQQKILFFPAGAEFD